MVTHCARHRWRPRTLGLNRVNQKQSKANPRRGKRRPATSGPVAKADQRIGVPKSTGKNTPPGLVARELAVDLVVAVLTQNRAFDEALTAAFAAPRYADLEARDRGLARQIAATTLRYARPLQARLDSRLDKPLSARYARIGAILLTAAAQLCRLAIPPHAVISLAVDQTRYARAGSHLDKLVNAVLRGLVRDGVSVSSDRETIRETLPGWMWLRWVKNYGEATAQDIAEASLQEAALDLSVKSAPPQWAERLNGAALATDTVRLVPGGRIEDLEGFASGDWWVQDAAAALPARLASLTVGPAAEVADLCAAPGGKTALLAATGARVTAVEISADRLQRLAANLDRLGLSAELVEADIATWNPARQFDAVLLDAPCTATGTIRRHPDIIHLKRESDVARLATIQASLLENAVNLVRPGGCLVYCTCSLEPEEGEQQMSAFLASHPEFEVMPIEPGLAGIEASWITPEGYLRTLPPFTPTIVAEGDGVSVPKGMDGFFAARLRRL